MRISINLAGVLAISLLLSAPALANASNKSVQGDAVRGKEIAAGTCAGCHNADGNSVIPINPILAGQHASYITKQLMDFKAGADGESAKRESQVMAPMVAELSPEDMQDLAAFYAQQTPVAAKSNENDENVLELGEIIYRGGNLENEVPACASCHLPNGAGIPPHYPRLAGQHADYTYTQLQAFDDNIRTNDDNKVMRNVVSRMTAKEKRAVAEFIANLE